MSKPKKPKLWRGQPLKSGMILIARGVRYQIWQASQALWELRNLTTRKREFSMDARNFRYSVHSTLGNQIFVEAR